MKQADPPPLGVFWECLTCGFRYVEAPFRHPPRGSHCPRCGGNAHIAAKVLVPLQEHKTSPPPPPGPRLAVLLDNVRSAYNVGAAFRTADGAGVERLYLTGITPTPPHRGIAKTALGADQRVVWHTHPNSVHLSARLQAEGWALWALETAPKAVSLPDLLQGALPARVVVAVGNEVAGLDPELLARADAVIALPMWGVKRSLNVISALAVVLYGVRLFGERGVTRGGF